MAYSFQTYSVGQVLTAAQMNQEEVNTRDHIHGKDGVGGTTRTLSPETTNTYDLGTSALFYRTLYANDWQGPPFARLQWMRIFSDFNVKSLSNAPPAVAGAPARWNITNTDATGTSYLAFIPSSQGYVEMFHDGGLNNSRIHNVYPETRAAISNWGSMDYDALVSLDTWNGTSVGVFMGLGEIDFTVTHTVVQSGDSVAWMTAASAAVVPTTRAGVATTTGNSLGWPVNTTFRFAVHLSSGTAQFTVNGSLWQTLTTNLPSSRALVSVTELKSAGVGASPTMRVFDMLFSVNSTT